MVAGIKGGTVETMEATTKEWLKQRTVKNQNRPIVTHQLLRKNYSPDWKSDQFSRVWGRGGRVQPSSKRYKTNKYWDKTSVEVITDSAEGQTCFSCVFHGSLVGRLNAELLQHQLLVLLWNQSLLVRYIHRWLVRRGTFWVRGRPAVRPVAPCGNKASRR